jgi:hypothetical protein
MEVQQSSDIVKPTRGRGLKVVYVKPILDHLPKPHREETLEEKVGGRLAVTLANEI